MELKRISRKWRKVWTGVLIVPYGIETLSYKALICELYFVLIVPYGIETWDSKTEKRYASVVLIVPYGIETENGLERYIEIGHVLIVPYGIETLLNLNVDSLGLRFNRTLWNWNLVSGALKTKSRSFNRTLWNWNLWITIEIGINFLSFNRTLWNWNS